MNWSNDPELHALFRAELDERVARLLAGAEALQAGEALPDLIGTMVREGHTIKGTARVMGFEAISRAGHIIEVVWRGLQQGDIAPSADLGAALQRVVTSLHDAVSADPVTGTPELKAALAVLVDARSEDPEPAAATDPVPGAAATETGREVDDAHSLGGLLGALESWAQTETIQVNAARLFRLINQLAAHRIEAEAARTAMFTALAEAERQGIDTGRIESAAAALASLKQSAGALERESLILAAVPISDVTNTLPQLVRYLAKKTEKSIAFEVVGDDLAVDRQVLDRLSDPIRQLVVNAIAHGIEPPAERELVGKPPTGRISVVAAIKDHQLELVIEDDGRGIDWDMVQRVAESRGLLPPDAGHDTLRSLVFAPGFTTSSTQTELIGDGAGLAKVVEAVEALYGSLSLETEKDQGTRIVLTVPTSRALQRALLVEAAEQVWGIPEAAVDDVLPIAAIDDEARSSDHLVWRDRTIPFVGFGDCVGVTDVGPFTHVVVVASPVGPVALGVSSLRESREVAAKELGPLLSGKSSHITGAALLGGDEVALLVDAGRIAERARAHRTAGLAMPVVLVVDDSQGARHVVAGTLASSGFSTVTAASAQEAVALVRDRVVDAMIVDFSMPETDGIELVSMIRASHPSLPIIMLSGVATQEDQVKAGAAGVDVYFDKADFREGALADALRELLEGRPTPSEAMQP